MKYICINCKKEFDEIPPLKLNECFSGHKHIFVKNSALMSDEKRLRISNRNIRKKENKKDV